MFEQNPKLAEKYKEYCKKYTKRWYDKDENIRMILFLLETSPRELKFRLTIDLLRIISNHKKTRTKVDINGPVTEKEILEIFNFAHTKRWHDKIPALATLINNLTAVPKDRYNDINKEFFHRVDTYVEKIGLKSLDNILEKTVEGPAIAEKLNLNNIEVDIDFKTGKKNIKGKEEHAK